jgi:hypothetical protein
MKKRDVTAKNSRQLTKVDVKRRIEGLDDETAKATVCGLVGHSRIQTGGFGYYYCGRCGTQVGDTLASDYRGAKKAVLVGHDCEVCRTNAKALTWRDTFLAPNPFSKP